MDAHRTQVLTVILLNPHLIEPTSCFDRYTWNCAKAANTMDNSTTIKIYQWVLWGQSTLLHMARQLHEKQGQPFGRMPSPTEAQGPAPAAEPCQPPEPAAPPPPPAPPAPPAPPPPPAPPAHEPPCPPAPAALVTASLRDGYTKQLLLYFQGHRHFDVSKRKDLWRQTLLTVHPDKSGVNDGRAGAWVDFLKLVKPWFCGTAAK